MKKINHIIALLLVFVMLFSFAACGGGSSNTDNKQDQVQNQVDDKTDESQDTDQPQVDNNQETSDANQSQNNNDKNNNINQAPSNTQNGQDTEKKDELKVPTKADAQAYIGKSASALIGALGSPVSSQYSPSCMGEGEDGELVYNGFTVYTYREGGSEKVVDVA